MTTLDRGAESLRRHGARHHSPRRTHTIRYVGWQPRALSPAPCGPGAPEAQATGVGIDGTGDELDRAARQQRAELESDLAIVLALQSFPVIASGTRLPRRGGAGAATTDADRRRLAMLALRRADHSDDADQARELARAALTGGPAPTEGTGLVSLLAAASVLGAAGRSREAERTLDAIVAQCARTRSRAVMAAAHAARGRQRLDRGALEDARVDLESALAAAIGAPWETMIDDGRAQLLRVYAERGDVDRAERELHAWRAEGPLPATALGVQLLIERGRLRLVQGRAADAVADLEAARERLGERADSILFDWRVPAAQAHYTLGQRRTALTLARAGVKRARAWGAPRPLGAALAALGMIEGGAAGVARVRDAVDVLSASTACLELARTLVILGSLLRRIGKPGCARVELLSGRELALECGAQPLAELAEQEIAASGATRRRRTELNGVGALTPSEERVARLAAHGLSNPEIARTLYVTRKTVEMHLGNAYRKLRITSRQQLAVALPAATT